MNVQIYKFKYLVTVNFLFENVQIVHVKKGVIQFSHNYLYSTGKTYVILFFQVY